MENKLWALLEETLNIKYSGGWEIMNQSQEMVIELLCDVGNYDK